MRRLEEHRIMHWKQTVLDGDNLGLILVWGANQRWIYPQSISDTYLVTIQEYDNPDFKIM